MCNRSCAVRKLTGRGRVARYSPGAQPRRRREERARSALLASPTVGVKDIENNVDALNDAVEAAVNTELVRELPPVCGTGAGRLIGGRSGLFSVFAARRANIRSAACL